MEFKLFDFNVYNEKSNEAEDNISLTSSGGDDDDDEEGVGWQRNACLSKFMIQMFGINETGNTCSVLVEGFKPFFYVKVADHWTFDHRDAFF